MMDLSNVSCELRAESCLGRLFWCDLCYRQNTLRHSGSSPTAGVSCCLPGWPCCWQVTHAAQGWGKENRHQPSVSAEQVEQRMRSRWGETRQQGQGGQGGECSLKYLYHRERRPIPNVSCTSAAPPTPFGSYVNIAACWYVVSIYLMAIINSA